MGDILRKLKCGMIAPTDRYFFAKNKSGVLSMHSQRVKRANEYCKTSVQLDSDVPKLLDYLFRSETGVLSVGEIRELYKSMPLGKVWPPSFMQCTK